MTANVRNRIQLLNHLVNDLYNVPEVEEVTSKLPPSPAPQLLSPIETTDTKYIIGDNTTLEEREAREKQAELTEMSKSIFKISR